MIALPDEGKNKGPRDDLRGSEADSLRSEAGPAEREDDGERDAESLRGEAASQGSYNATSAAITAAAATTSTIPVGSPILAAILAAIAAVLV